MSDATQLPHLLRLFDDPSPVVQTAVRERLTAIGPRLPELMDALQPPVAAELREAVLALVPDPAPNALLEIDPPRTKNVRESDSIGSGKVVRHRRYGYRGLVVHRDERCRASEDWYRSNPTQPDRDQPWYHVLVHGSDQITYVAEVNLELEGSEQEIQHPLIPQFFHRLEGRYQRNDRPWPRE